MRQGISKISYSGSMDGNGDTIIDYCTGTLKVLNDFRFC